MSHLWFRKQAAGGNSSPRGRAEACPAGDTAREISALKAEIAALRWQEEERARLAAAAREAGLRIRSHLDLDSVIHDTVTAIEGFVPEDLAYLLLSQDGRMGLPQRHEHDWILPPAFAEFPAELVPVMRDLLARRESQVLQDLTGPDAALVPPGHLGMLRAAGVCAFLVSPFGVDSDLAGVVVALRRRPGRPWSHAEIAAFSSIAADIGWALDHARQYEARNRLVRELKELDQRRNDFIASISHELRTPLTSITGYLEILQDDEEEPLTPGQRRMLEPVVRNASRLRALIEDVLTLSRIESGTFRAVKAPMQLDPVISAAAAQLEPAAAAAGIGLTVSCPAGGLRVRGDPGQLAKALTNVLSNAVKFARAGGSITLTASAEHGEAVIAVRDTGMGIPEADQPAIGSPFFRASNAVGQSVQGTGLGLAIVRTIVANHGGSMTIESGEGRGTAVIIRLPLLAGA